MNDREQQDAIYQLMKTETPYLPDEGFSEQVMKGLPPSRGFRARVLAFSWVLAIGLGTGLWWVFERRANADFMGFSWPALLSSAFIAFWVMLGLLVYVMATERMIEIE